LLKHEPSAQSPWANTMPGLVGMTASLGCGACNDGSTLWRTVDAAHRSNTRSVANMLRGRRTRHRAVTMDGWAVHDGRRRFADPGP
jgi:hypothetical protein